MEAAGLLPGIGLDDKISELREIAQLIAGSIALSAGMAVPLVADATL